MRTQLAAFIIATALILIAGTPVPAPTQKGTVCWPLNFAGITVGVSTDSQVQRLLGKGVFRPDEGHTGGRYFIDTKNTATLHIVEGVDKVVDELSVSEGVMREVRAKERPGAISRWFEPEEGFGNWHALHLGSTQKDVLSNLGEPQKRLTANQWQYETTCSCELPAYLTVSFKAGRLVELSLSEQE